MFSRFKKTDQPAGKPGPLAAVPAGNTGARAPAPAASKPAAPSRQSGGPVAVPKGSAEVVAAEKEKKRKKGQKTEKDHL